MDRVSPKETKRGRHHGESLEANSLELRIAFHIQERTTNTGGGRGRL